VTGGNERAQTHRFDPARLTDLAAVRDAVREVCTAAGAPHDVWMDVRLATEEAFTNILEHGYGGAAGPVDLEIRATDEEIVVRLSDDARPFDPAAVPSPGLADARHDGKIGGLGWHLISRVMDEVRHVPGTPRGNVLTLVKRLPPGG